MSPRAAGAARLAAFLLLLSAATVSVHFTSPYLISDRLRAAVALAFALLAWLAARAVEVQAAVAGGWLFLRRHDRVAVGVAAAFVLAASCVVCRAVLDPIPHIADEVAYLFQARVFASGRLSVPAPPLLEFFPSEWLIVRGGKWFGVFPPGWPLLLSVGVRAGVPWLVNPALGALSLIAVHRLAEALIGRAKALAVALLCALSPFFLYMCASFMSHPAALLFVTLSVLCLLRGAAAGGLGAFSWAGCFAGLAFVTRPLDALAMWCVAVAAVVWRRPVRRTILGACVSAAGLAAGGAAYTLYNHALSGRWLVPLLTLASARNHLGFGPDIGPHGHTLAGAALNLSFNLAVLGADLFGWPVCGLCFAFSLLCFGRLAWPHRLSASLVTALAVGYFFYWYHGVCFGARFFFSSLPFLLVLTVEGVSQAPASLPARMGPLGARAASVKIFVALGFAFSALVYVPWVSAFEPYHNQRNVDMQLARYVADNHIRNAIVFVGPEPQDFASGVFANALDPGEGPVMFALERGARDGLLSSRFPGRAVFHYRHMRAPRTPPAWLDRILGRGYVMDLARGLVARLHLVTR